LYFSSMNIGLTQRDIWRFMKVYFGMPLRKILSFERNLLNMASAAGNDRYNSHGG
ncbi:hypothetical protein ACSLO8_31100, partial [Escherichia coli]